MEFSRVRGTFLKNRNLSPTPELSDIVGRECGVQGSVFLKFTSDAASAGTTF